MKELDYTLIGEGTDENPYRPDAFDDPEIDNSTLYWDKGAETLYQR